MKVTWDRLLGELLGLVVAIWIGKYLMPTVSILDLANFLLINHLSFKLLNRIVEK